MHAVRPALSPSRPGAKPGVTAELRPQKLDGTLAFMFESRWTILPTAQAMDAGFRQRDDDAAWSGLSRNFR